jgi:hypothetical protein
MGIGMAMRGEQQTISDDRAVVLGLNRDEIQYAREVVALVSDIALLVLTVAFAVVSIFCALHGGSWPLAAGSGGSSGGLDGADRL